MDYRKEDIKRYFRDWVAAFGNHHLDIINFLNEKKDLSIRNTKDNVWIDTFEIVHQDGVKVYLSNRPEVWARFKEDPIKEIRENPELKGFVKKLGIELPTE